MPATLPHQALPRRVEVSGSGGEGHDEVQFLTGQGPCRDAALSGTPIVVPDLRAPTETRWPLRHAATDADATTWTQMHEVIRAEIAQATGMIMAQLDIGPAEALLWLRAHAYATATSPTHVARAIIERRLRMEP